MYSPQISQEYKGSQRETQIAREYLNVCDWMAKWDADKTQRASSVEPDNQKHRALSFTIE